MTRKLSDILRVEALDNEDIDIGYIRFLLISAADDLDDKDQLIADYEEVNEDKKRLVRELDVLLNGDGAAKQASLCDIVSQLRIMKCARATNDLYPDIISVGGMDEYERVCNDYIYESPDGGKTVYRRRLGELLREQVK